MPAHRVLPAPHRARAVAFPARRARPWWADAPLMGAAGFLAVLVLAGLLRGAHGSPDTALAAALAAQGPLGVDWAAIAAGSTLSTSLVAGTFTLTGAHALVPIVVDAAAAVVFLALAHRALRAHDVPPVAAGAVLVALVLVTPLAPLVLTGEGHVLTVLLVTAFVLESARVRAAAWRVPALAALAALACPETVVVVAAVAALTALAGRHRDAAAALGAGGVPALLAGAATGGARPALSLPDPGALAVPVLILVAVAVMAFLRELEWVGTPWHQRPYTLAAFALAGLAHALTVPPGLVPDAPLVALGMIAVAIVAPRHVRTRRWSALRETAVPRAAALGVLAALALAPFAARAIAALPL